MSYKVTKNGITIQVDSENEFKVLIDALKIDLEKTKAVPPQLTGTTIDHALNEFFDSLPVHTNQYKVLVALKNNPNGLTAPQLMRQIGFTASHALGGTLGNITKNAKKFGLRSGDIYKTIAKFEHLTYKLTEKMVEVMGKQHESDSKRG